MPSNYKPKLIFRAISSGGRLAENSIEEKKQK
jgi:hypothetical protein